MSTFSKNGRRSVAAVAAVVLLGTLAYSVQPGSAVASGPVGEAQSAPKAPPTIPLPPPSDFVQQVDNLYSPFLPGMRWIYGGDTAEGHERITVDVLNRTKMIEGIRATVVHDVVKLDGELIEATFDWYAQDLRGTVWYLGEDTKVYRNGRVVSREGSWEAGVDGAMAGIVMFAHPKPGEPYRQEFYRGHAEDQAQFLTLSTQATTEAGHFSHVRLTEDTTALDPTVVELKFYAPGVGIVQEFDLSPEAARTELLSFQGP